MQLISSFFFFNFLTTHQSKQNISENLVILVALRVEVSSVVHDQSVFGSTFYFFNGLFSRREMKIKFFDFHFI